MSEENGYEFHLLTPERWGDFEKLFGAHGAFGGCWCMWWLIPHAEFNRGKGEGNRMAMKERVERGLIPGILAYSNGEAVGWCAFGPRESYLVLERSRAYRRVDDTPVWSVVCFYVAKGHRRKGVTTALLKAVIEEVRRRGGKVLEGYPNVPKESGEVDAFVYMGLEPAFRAAGFEVVETRGSRKVVMRKLVNG